MKKAVTISLFIFWMIATAIFAGGLVVYDKSKNSNTPVSDGASPSSGTSDNAAGGSGVGNGGGSQTSGSKKLVLSLAETAKHNSSKSCWLLISGKIYDVTNYINAHPGGANEIISSCGKDATQAYDTKGGRGNSHSGNADAMLSEYFIGNLNQSLSVPTTGGATSGGANVIPAPNPTTTRSRSWDDD